MSDPERMTQIYDEHGGNPIDIAWVAVSDLNATLKEQEEVK